MRDDHCGDSYKVAGRTGSGIRGSNINDTTQPENISIEGERADTSALIPKEVIPWEVISEEVILWERGCYQGGPSGRILPVPAERTDGRPRRVYHRQQT
jgi:hypothetical protein